MKNVKVQLLYEKRWNHLSVFIIGEQYSQNEKCEPSFCKIGVYLLSNGKCAITEWEMWTIFLYLLKGYNFLMETVNNLSAFIYHESREITEWKTWTIFLYLFIMSLERLLNRKCEPSFCIYLSCVWRDYWMENVNHLSVFIIRVQSLLSGKMWNPFCIFHRLVKWQYKVIFFNTIWYENSINMALFIFLKFKNIENWESSSQATSL